MAAAEELSDDGQPRASTAAAGFGGQRRKAAGAEDEGAAIQSTLGQGGDEVAQPCVHRWL